MAVLPNSSTCLELTISIPGLSSSSTLPLHSSGEGGGDNGQVVTPRDIDINQVPSETEEECVEEEDDNSQNDGPPRKKLRLTKEQSLLLEESFRQHHTLNPKQKEVLALQLKLKPRQVEVWFQNRRASLPDMENIYTRFPLLGTKEHQGIDVVHVLRSKLKQTEMECEYLRRWFGTLTEQNKRLQKELEELRAMRVDPPTVISPHSCGLLPASSMTMCPRCERVTVNNNVRATAATPISSVSASSFAPARHERSHSP